MTIKNTFYKKKRHNEKIKTTFLCLTITFSQKVFLIPIYNEKSHMPTLV